MMITFLIVEKVFSQGFSPVNLVNNKVTSVSRPIISFLFSPSGCISRYVHIYINKKNIYILFFFSL